MTISIITIELIGSQTLDEKLERLKELQKQGRTKEAFERAVEFLSSTTSDKAPDWNSVLQASFDEEVGMIGDDIAGTVFTDVTYAPFHERGVDPYWPNIDNLEAWVADNSDQDGTAYGLALWISTHGIPALKYAEEALLEEEDQIVELIGEAIGEIMEGKY